VVDEVVAGDAVFGRHKLDRQADRRAGNEEIGEGKVGVDNLGAQSLHHTPHLAHPIHGPISRADRAGEDRDTCLTRQFRQRPWWAEENAAPARDPVPKGIDDVATDAGELRHRHHPQGDRGSER
jgi:hypothetical protein